MKVQAKDYTWQTRMTNKYNNKSRAPGEKLPDSTFKMGPSSIASILKAHSNDLKSAMAKLNSYINRQGRNLQGADKNRLEQAKDALRQAYGQPPKKKTSAKKVSAIVECPVFSLPLEHSKDNSAWDLISEKPDNRSKEREQDPQLKSVTPALNASTNMDEISIDYSGFKESTSASVDKVKQATRNRLKLLGFSVEKVTGPTSHKGRILYAWKNKKVESDFFDSEDSAWFDALQYAKSKGMLVAKLKRKVEARPDEFGMHRMRELGVSTHMSGPPGGEMWTWSGGGKVKDSEAHLLGSEDKAWDEAYSQAVKQGLIQAKMISGESMDAKSMILTSILNSVQDPSTRMSSTEESSVEEEEDGGDFIENLAALAGTTIQDNVPETTIAPQSSWIQKDLLNEVKGDATFDSLDNTFNEKKSRSNRAYCTTREVGNILSAALRNKWFK